MAEDRAGAEPGIRLAIASLNQHCPNVSVMVFRPNPSESFCRWLEKYPQVRLSADPLPNAWDWNCKPQALLRVLDSGYEEAFWLDSDMLVARSPLPVLQVMNPLTVGIAEEIATAPSFPSDVKTRGWDLPVGNVFREHFSSALVRVTGCHRPLLNRWMELLSDPRYTGCQPDNNNLKPPHLDTDQELLTALLGASEFSHLGVYLFRNGEGLVHGGGALAHSLSARFRGLRRLKPYFYHAPGSKPWVTLPPKAGHVGRFWVLRRLLQEVSPYVAEAKRYEREIDVPCPWMHWRTPVGTILNLLSLGHPSLRGLPVTMVAALLKTFGIGLLR